MCLMRLLWNVTKVSSSSSSLWYNDRLQPKCCISAIFALFFLHIPHQGPGPLFSLLILVLVAHWIAHSCPFIAPMVQSFSSESVSDCILTIRCLFFWQFYRQREAKRHHHLWRRWRLASRRDPTVSDRCLRAVNVRDNWPTNLLLSIQRLAQRLFFLQSHFTLLFSQFNLLVTLSTTSEMPSMAVTIFCRIFRNQVKIPKQKILL